MRIGFFAENCLPFHANSLNERPLGGTETGVIRLAEQLCSMGHTVEVFTRFNHQSGHTNQQTNVPKYLSPENIHKSDIFDVLVLVKDYRPARFKLPSKKVFYWTGDGPEQYINFGVGDQRMIKAINALLTVSEWQADVLCQSSGFPRDKAYFLGNGVHLPYFEGNPNKSGKKLFYASSPNRGLTIAYQTFKLVQKEHPDATLHVYAGFDVYNDHTPFTGPLIDQFLALKELLSKDSSIVMHNNLIQKDLAQSIMNCSALFYPNQFVETSCIVALEAQAAGCPVIASNSGGLPETVSDRGILISGVPGSAEYILKFSQATINLLNDTETLARLSQRTRTYAFANFGWDKVAKRFEDICNRTY
jgi:glycosyltransferase involved in cell wall biosynthesis